MRFGCFTFCKSLPKFCCYVNYFLINGLYLFLCEKIFNKIIINWCCQNQLEKIPLLWIGDVIFCLVSWYPVAFLKLRNHVALSHVNYFLHFFRLQDPGPRHIILHHGSSRKDIYKRLFQVLWFGNALGKGESGKTATYVYPREIRNLVRRRYPDSDAGNHDEDYEEKVGVHHVTIQEILSTKWPAPPKGCAVCKQSRGKPY